MNEGEHVFCAESSREDLKEIPHRVSTDDAKLIYPSGLTLERVIDIMRKWGDRDLPHL
jgi:hypothetical protein